MDGFLNLHKSPGWTSHDCVAKVRRLVRQKKVGHGGTLDPAATGVLPIALGRATRLLQYLPGTKAYRGVIRFGLTTSTDDLEGAILSQQTAENLSLDMVLENLNQFKGIIDQIPPRYSAIQVEGQRLYDLARNNQDFTVPQRQVEVMDVGVVQWQGGEFPELTLDIRCGAGTYIRSIARDLGAALGVGGTLAALTRTASAGMTLADSLDLDTLAAQLEADTFQPLAPETLLHGIPVLTLTPQQGIDWGHGKRLGWESLAEGEANPPEPGTVFRLKDSDGEFRGIGEVQVSELGTCLKPKLVF
ncbi:tRNA pseudouridine(55) synthase TruB [Prochlorothrix hollandica]|uniref:tRNA pseudouridine synthase B n=1 Tax=Prochlorothrix hollandica PCC 9006 = CALU 1027 TaxID=317619 RepID=A0A0M2PZW7_PROHO|nr:tRNA pseudouridine synthase B [Prochlorothrix hollandica PCC 9006 = CALU 1027]